MQYTGTQRCECGEATGQWCDHEITREDAVIIEWMPLQFRESHRAARNAGSCPHNGALRLCVAQTCAAFLRETDGEWCSI